MTKKLLKNSSLLKDEPLMVNESLDNSGIVDNSGTTDSNVIKILEGSGTLWMGNNVLVEVLVSWGSGVLTRSHSGQNNDYHGSVEVSAGFTGVTSCPGNSYTCNPSDGTLEYDWIGNACIQLSVDYEYTIGLGKPQRKKSFSTFTIPNEFRVACGQNEW